MLGSQRQEEIIRLIKLEESVSVKKLTELLYVSEATVRRDLNALTKSGAIKRVYGGAALVDGSDRQVPLFLREKEHGREKQEICEKAVRFIKDGYILFIDGSSTAQMLVRLLAPFHDLVVITNSTRILDRLAEMHIKTYCTGGYLVGNSSVLVGADAEAFVGRYNADICFLSCKGLSDDGKLTDTSAEETELRKKYMKHAKKTVFLMTSSKFGKTYLHTLCDSTEADCILSDKALPAGVRTRGDL